MPSLNLNLESKQIISNLSSSIKVIYQANNVVLLQ